MTNRRFPVAGTSLTVPWEVMEHIHERHQRYRRLRNFHACEEPIKLWACRRWMADRWWPGWREIAE